MFDAAFEVIKKTCPDEPPCGEVMALSRSNAFEEPAPTAESQTQIVAVLATVALLAATSHAESKKRGERYEK
jgi:hypothetical protein